jgi:hypothetical protein
MRKSDDTGFYIARFDCDLSSHNLHPELKRDRFIMNETTYFQPYAETNDSMVKIFQEDMKKLLKRMSSILLSICMIITMLPTVAFATEDGVTGDTPVGLSTTYTISGTVRQNGSNNLLEGASVQLINSSDEKVGSAVTTNSSGVYIISDVAPGNYRLVLEKVGYIKATVGTFAVSNANITDFNTTLVPIYTVSGTVSEINGSGLADA